MAGPSTALRSAQDDRVGVRIRERARFARCPGLSPEMGERFARASCVVGPFDCVWRKVPRQTSLGMTGLVVNQKLNVDAVRRDGSVS